jgi:hypothetical protein
VVVTDAAGVVVAAAFVDDAFALVLAVEEDAADELVVLVMFSWPPAPPETKQVAVSVGVIVTVAGESVTEL